MLKFNGDKVNIVYGMHTASKSSCILLNVMGTDIWHQVEKDKLYSFMNKEFIVSNSITNSLILQSLLIWEG